MLEWSAVQATEISTTAIDLEFLPAGTNVERGVPNLEFVLQQMHTALMALTNCEADDIVAEDPVGVVAKTAESEICFARSFLLGGVCVGISSRD